LLSNVSRLAKILTDTYEVTKGDRVLIYMPMIPESAFAMLACARIGAIHSVVFGGFAAKELANRIEDCKPKLIITASCGLEPRKVIKYLPIVTSALEL
jgi:propionyl-CoA synthetase